MPTRTSIANGAWNSLATWDTGIPVDGDTAVIDHNVYIDSDVTVGTNTSGETQYAITINSGGVLRWANPPSGDWTLTLHGGILVNEGGTFQIGTLASPMSASYVADVHFDPSAASRLWRIYAPGGVVDIHGAPAYHMGSTSMQRAKLVGDISAGSDVAFVLDRDADWEVDDWVAIGCGADKTYTPNSSTHRPEKVQIKTKTDARHYTADFSYLHRDDDHLITLTRNVVLRGNGSDNYGFRIVTSNPGTTEPINTRLRMTWATLQYAGNGTSYSQAGIYWGAGPSTVTEFFPSQALWLKNLAFDEDGGDWTGTFPNEYYRGVSVAIYASAGFAEAGCIEDLYAYKIGSLLWIQGAEELEVSRLAALGVGQDIAHNVGGKSVSLDDIWGCGLNWSVTTLTAFDGGFRSIENVELFNVYYGWTLPTPDPYGSLVDLMRARNWKLYHVYHSGITGYNGHLSFLLESIEFYRCYNYALNLAGDTQSLFIRDCSFDLCSAAFTTIAAVYLSSDSFWGDILFQNCSFGTVSRNRGANVRIGNGYFDQLAGRARAEGCEFVEPLDWATSMVPQAYYNKTWAWSVWSYSSDWRYRTSMGRLSFELANCVVKDSGGSDQLHTDYPAGVTRIVLGHSGGEMHDEQSIVLDGTFKQRLLPFNGGIPYTANLHNPIGVPLASGETVTVKLSLRKTKDGVLGLPGIRIDGPGFTDEAYMTPALLDTWEELEVSGTADTAGMAYLYVIGGTNNSYNNSSHNADPAFGPPPVTGGDWMTMFDCIVYADGLSIGVA